jgi:hypothetical protein
MKIGPLGVELIHADRGADKQTDMTKLILAFRNFAIAPKKEIHIIKCSIASDCFDKRQTSAPHIFYTPGALATRDVIYM